MPIERAADHPTFDFGGNTMTSYASPSRGTSENALFRAQIPAGAALPRHRHDHEDVFVIAEGSGTMVIGDERTPVDAGDCVVVPIGAWHHLEAGADGCAIVVTVDAGTQTIREDGSGGVPPWVA
jgi:mannose-6-phosphate isomerase-like protein (cupin superfamily)